MSQLSNYLLIQSTRDSYESLLKVVLAMVPGYPASVRVGPGTEAPVRVRNRQETEPPKSWWVVTRTGHIPAGFWPGWNRTAVPIVRFLPLWLQLSI